MKSIIAWFRRQSARSELECLCDRLHGWRGFLSEEERHFVALMGSRLKASLPIFPAHEKRLRDIFTVVQGEITA
jgi:hypothetical protein